MASLADLGNWVTGLFNKKKQQPVQVQPVQTQPSFIERVQQTIGNATQQYDNTMRNFSGFSTLAQKPTTNIFNEPFYEMPQTALIRRAIVQPTAKILDQVVKSGYAIGKEISGTNRTLDMQKQEIENAIAQGYKLTPTQQQIYNQTQSLRQRAKPSDYLNVAAVGSIPKVAANVVGGGIGMLFKAIDNYSNKKPITADLGNAYDEGFAFSAKLGSLDKFVDVGGNIILKPLAEKFPVIQKVITKLTPGEVTNFKTWLTSSLKMGNKSGTTMGIYGAFEDANNGEERLMNMWNQYKQGFAYGTGTHAVFNTPAMVEGQTKQMRWNEFKKDKITVAKINELNKADAANPVEEGKVRVYQAVGQGNTTDWAFTNPEQLREFKRGVTAPNENFQYVDVNPSQVKPVKGRPGVVKIIGETGAPKTDVNAYIQNQIKRQEDAARKADRGVITIVKEGVSDFKKKWVEMYSPLIDPLNTYAKKNKVDILPTKNIDDQISRVLASDTIASRWLRDNGYEATIGKDRNELGQYLIARDHVTGAARQGKITGRDLAQDAAYVEQNKARFETRANEITRMYRELTQYAEDNGMIPKGTVAKLSAENPNYVRWERIFSPEEQATIKGPSKAVASLSKQSTLQKMEGSERPIDNPVLTLINRAYKTISEGERNKAASMLVSYRAIPGNPYGLEPLRTAENVKARITIYSELKDLGQAKNTLEGLLSTRNKWARKLTTQLRNLGKEGVNAYLKQEVPVGDVALAPLTEGNRADLPIGNREVKNIINSLIEKTPDEIKMIKKKIGTREPKLTKILDQVSKLKGQLEEVNMRRSQLFDEAKLVQDAESRGKSTISLLKDGIKEIWEVKKDVADAAKNLNKEQMPVWLKVITTPVRIFKAGTTGLRIPFVAANVVKDQLTAFVNSERPASTSLMNPVNVVQSLYEAVGHGETFKQMERAGAMGTSFDIYRDKPYMTIEQIAANKQVGSRVLYKITHPEQLLRSFENILSRGEEFTRIQQFKGTYDQLIKEGRTKADAEILAARAARQNTVDFQRMGEFGRVANWIIPYFNAGIQGSRSLLRSAERDPVGTGAKLTASVFLPMIATTMWNTATPDRKAAYDDILAYEKENNFILIPPNPKKDANGRWMVYKIPLSQEVANLANISRLYTLQAVDGTPVQAADIAADLIGTTTSLDMKRPVNQMLPQPAKPLYEAAYNVNTYTGNPLVPDYMKNLPPEEQVYKSTSGTMRAIGKATNTSPLVVQNTIKGYLGSTGTDVIGQLDKELANRGIIPKEQAQGMDIMDATAARFNRAFGGQTLKTAQEETQKGWSPRLTEAYNLIHTPKTLDENGLPANNRNETMAFAQLRLAQPQIMAREAQEARIKNKLDGTPINPLYNLPYDRQRTVLTLTTLAPGDDKSALQKANIDWLKQYWAESSQYFNQLKASGVKISDATRGPVASPYVQAQMDAKNWKDPQVQAYLDENLAYKNKVREELGLTPLADSKFASWPKKPKKVSIKKIKTKKISVTNIKIKKPKAAKMPKQPKLLTTAKKTTNIKIKA